MLSEMIQTTTILAMNMEVTKRPYAETGIRLSSSPFLKVIQNDYTEKRLGKRNSVFTAEIKKKECHAIRSIFSCTHNEALKISEFWDERKTSCETCSSKWKNCFSCVVNCNNEIKRNLFIALQNFGLKPELKHRVNKNGTFYSSHQAIDFDNILAIPDFFIDLGFKKLCIFIDNNTTYTGLQAKSVRDKLIDHSLMKLGFWVHRCTSTQINEDCSAVLLQITDKILKKKTTISPRMKRLKTMLG